MKEKDVRIFTLSTCFYCNKLKKILDENSISYQFTDIDLMPEDQRRSFLEELQKYNEKKSFPVVIVGNKAIVGFQEQVIREELGISR